MQATADLTQLLTEWRAGQAETLERLTSSRLRCTRKAARAERGSHTLQQTVVVHEALPRLVQPNVAMRHQGYLFALASRLMLHFGPRPRCCCGGGC